MVPLDANVRAELKWRAKSESARHPEWRYGGAAGFMLAWGKRFERGMLLKRRGGWYRAPKKCFGNAYRSVQEDPARYVYCEGFCWASSPFEHAWLIERQGPGAALDPTLGLTENYSYLGIPIRWEYVKDIASRRGIYGSVFDWYLQPEYPIFSGVHAPDIVIETV